MKKAGKRILFGLAALAAAGAAARALRTEKETVHPGNDERYRPENLGITLDTVLRGKTILFLGSSVTEGSGAQGVSFADYLASLYGVHALKEAVPGTTLVTEDERSYIPRLRMIDPACGADCFVCQLSTNDATKGKPLGEIAAGFDPAEFDEGTVTGAIETIIAYAKKVFSCPVVFYTGTRFESPAYAAMVERLLELKEKWGITVIDLWNDPEMCAVRQEDYRLYMADPIHPTQAGYLNWWTPRFEKALSALFSAG